MPGPSRYSGRVSGPQLAVPSAAMGGVEMDDGLGDRDEVDVVGRGGQVGGAMVGDRDLARLVEVDPETGAVASVSSSQRTSAWPPFSCGRMYGTYWSVTGRAQTPTSPLRLRSG